MPDFPYTFQIELPGGRPSLPARHIQRRLADMQGQYSDPQAYERLIQEGNPLLYEVYELARPEVPGELQHGLSILHPGKVGAEYYMTKGHFHNVLETAEFYYCLQGGGFMLMENPEGECDVKSLQPGWVLYVPPRWAHRSINTSPSIDLITLFAYPGNAGHNYGTIEKKGFRKIIVEKDGQPAVIENPRWQSTISNVD